MKKRIIGLFTIACIFVLLLPTLSVRAGDTSSFGKYNTISIGSSHSAAIKSDGSLWTWGKMCIRDRCYFCPNIEAKECICYTGIT